MTTQTQIDKVLDKVQKLMALATSPNENEAAAAAEKAQSLLAEHNLSMAQVSGAAKKKADGDLTIDKSKRNTVIGQVWRRSLAVGVAEMMFCKYFYTAIKEPSDSYRGYVAYDIHSFVGAPHNIEVCKLMFDYLCDAVERLAREGAKTVSKGERFSYMNAFKTQCTLRLYARIRQRIAAAKAGEVKSETTGTNLPALASLYDQTNQQLTEFLESKLGKLGKGRANRPQKQHSKGRMDGDAAGHKIGLDVQLTAKEKAKQIAN